MSHEDDFLEIARYDWLVTSRGDRLHAWKTGTFDPDWWALEDVTFHCGRRVERAFIPGLFTRMGADRCRRCCDATGLPRGVGSPKNDDACRALVGLS